MLLHRAAPAKLNRFLSVLGRRADGFHELELVTTILEGVPDLSDALAGEPAESLSLDIDGVEAGGLEADEANLVLRAWRLLEGDARRSLPARLRLTKHIPHGAGLGGGSSDAAAALQLGNDLFALGLAPTRLLELATALGSDVPLFLLGGTVLGLGRGERVFPLRSLPLEPILIVHPRLHVATASVYQALRQVGLPFPAPLPALQEGAAPPWRNDLTGAAIFVCPPLAEVRETLQASGGEPMLCGSGACWAVRYSTSAARNAARTELAGRHQEWRLWSVGA
jgi:4-diphosphocytidyl-2-C-methyl-D-erythritol kinase